MYFRRYTKHFSVFKTILFIGELLSVIQAYNLNIDKANVFNHPHKHLQYRESYFGFSVGLYNDLHHNDQSVIVGAPRANTSQKLIYEPGAVYKCGLDNNCKEWVLDNTVGEKYKQGTIFRQKSWLGATISVDNTDYPAIVVCAPRWKIKWGHEWYMNGLCYYAKTKTDQSFDDTRIEKFMPLSDRSEQTATDAYNRVYYKHGMGSLGFSLHTYSHKNQWKTIFGAPGAHSLLGATVLWSQDEIDSEYIVTEFDDNDHDTLGYSVTSGKYFGGDQIHFAAGAPRDKSETGRVRIFDYDLNQYKNMRILDTLEGIQRGEYFGAALTSCDVDNDGRDEIIVGAPMWTKNGDEGSVYIFTTKNTKMFKLTLQINGTVKDARFGTTVVCLGDIDRDGYKDIAVGAPYENNHGAVYIFNGNKNGLSGTWSQRIYGGDILHKPRGFGISISEPRDIDGNGYYDIAIGAYLSGHAVIVRSQPVVTVDVKIYRKPMKIYSNTTSLPIQICTSYRGERAPTALHTIIGLKVDVIHARAYVENFIRGDRTYIIPIKLLDHVETCENITILLRERIQNMIDPLEISASLALDPKFKSLSLSPREFYFDTAVINENKSRAEDNITIAFAIDCGTDNICNSDIKLNVTTNLTDGNRFVRGSKDAIKLFINVDNYGEPAYESLVHIFIPKFMGLTNILEHCQVSRSSEFPEFICSIGNPLRNQNNLTLELIMKQTRNTEDHIEIMAFVTTRSKNINPNQSTMNLTIYFDNDVDISVSGNAHKTSYSAYDNAGKQKPSKITFQHIYEVRKFGLSPVTQAHLNISIPSYIIDNKNKSKIEIVKVNRADILLRDSINEENSYCVPTEVDSIDEESKYLTKKNNPNNNTLYIDCTNPLVVCTTISCFLETSSISLTTVQVTITMELLLKNFSENVMNGTSIIYFESNGHVNITLPTGITQKYDNKPDYTQVGTIFDISTPIASPYHVPIWIIIVSVLVGIILLALLIFGLLKLGFFNRKKKEDLDELKSNEDEKYNIVLETSSSREMLDQD